MLRANRQHPVLTIANCVILGSGAVYIHRWSDALKTERTCSSETLASTSGSTRRQNQEQERHREISGPDDDEYEEDNLLG
jgi:hypothetical protein